MQRFQRLQHVAQRGLTLVESAAVLGVVSVLLGSGLPVLAQLKEASEMKSAAALLRTDLQYARTAAVSLGQPVRVQVRNDAEGSCYVIHAGPGSSCTCSPRGGATCVGTGWTLRSEKFMRDRHVVLSSTSSTMTFDGTQGTVTPTGTVTLSNDRGARLKVVVNVMGRTRTCQASGSSAGFPAC